MNPCVFCWSQYLRVLILSYLSCSIIVIMIVTSMQTDRQSIYSVCHEWLNDAIHGHMGDSDPKAQTHKATRKFHAIWCLMVSSSMVSIVHYEYIINEWWIINPLSSSLSPWLPCRNCGSLVLVARWRTEAFSQFCLQIALPYKKGNRKLIVPWSSFNTHRTTDNACACLLSH